MIFKTKTTAEFREYQNPKIVMRILGKGEEVECAPERKKFMGFVFRLCKFDDIFGWVAEHLLVEVIDNFSFDAIGQMTKDKYKNIANISWTDGSYAEYRYDGMNNCIFARVYTPASTSAGVSTPESVRLTHYIRDASGNILGVYEENV